MYLELFRRLSAIHKNGRLPALLLYIAEALRNKKLYNGTECGRRCFEGMKLPVGKWYFALLD